MKSDSFSKKCLRVLLSAISGWLAFGGPLALVYMLHYGNGGQGDALGGVTCMLGMWLASGLILVEATKL